MLETTMNFLDSNVAWVGCAALGLMIFVFWLKLASAMIEAQAYGYRFTFFGPIPKAELVKSELSKQHAERMKAVIAECEMRKARVEGSIDAMIKRTQDALNNRTPLEDILNHRREEVAL